MAVLFSDAFNRSDSDTIGSPDVGTSWTERAANWQIVSNQVVKDNNDAGASGGGILATNGLSDADYEVTADVTTGGSASGGGGWVGILARGADYSTDDADMYTLVLTGGSNGSAQMYRRVSGSWTQIDSVSFNWSGSTTYAMLLGVNGSTIYADVDSSGLSLSTTDTNITAAGYAGLQHSVGDDSNEVSFGASADNFSVDDFTGSALTATGSPALPIPTADGDAKLGRPASGAPSLPLPTASGTAVNTIKASGSPALPLITADGDAAVLGIHSAAGNPTLPLPTGAGTATRTVKGSGTPTLPLITANGDGQVFGAITASGALTGTAAAGLTEAQVVAGSETIVLTLTGDTWIAAGTGPIGTTAETQAMLDGLTAALSPTNGWNNAVTLSPSDLVRTSDTVATLTLPATAGYGIDSDETLTWVIPNAVLTTSGSDVTATPTITITAQAEEAESRGGFIPPHLVKQIREKLRPKKRVEEVVTEVEAMTDAAVEAVTGEPEPAKVTKAAAKKIRARVLTEAVDSGLFFAELDVIEANVAALVNRELARRRVEAKALTAERERQARVVAEARAQAERDEADMIAAVILLIESE